MGIAKTSRKAMKAIGFLKTVETPEADVKLLETIRKNVQLDAEATDHQRELELDDLRFCDPSTQWDDQDRRNREASGRPCLTEDRLGPFLSQIINEQRKNKPGVQVNPVDDSGDPETAEVIQGLIRHIEYNSNADTAYDTAFEWAVKVGRGFYRICTDYVDSEGFEQEIQIKRVPNPHMVFVDPAAVESDFSDMRWGGFKVWMSRDDFKAAYPNAELASAGASAWRAIGDDAPEWMSANGDACMVVEYFWKEQTEKTIGEGDQKRKAIKTTVKWCKATAVEILESGEFASRYIPIIAVLGKESVIEGKRTWAGLVRAGKDPQKRHNYLLTAQVERIAFMPIATFVGPKGFMGQGENKRAWGNAHKNPIAGLEFEIIGDDGQTINRPEFITAEAPIRAVTEALMGAEEGMKAVLGMFDPSIGNREGSQSGLAIGRLQAQSETGNFHFQDNLSRALRYEGRILCDLIPTVYDTERVIRIIGEDGAQDLVRVNGEPQDGDSANVREGIKRMYDLTTGKYDVTVSAGPSYQSKRQEDRALLMGMLQGPMGEQIATAAPDLVASTLDSPIAKLLAERLKKLLPPQLQDKEEGQPDLPPQVQQMLQQAQMKDRESGQMIEQLTAAVHDLKDQLEDKQAEVQAKAETDMAKAQLDSQTKIAIAEMNNQTELLKTQAQIMGAGVVPKLQAKIAELEQGRDELAELVLAHHAAIDGPANPPVEAGEPTETPSLGVPPGGQPANAGPEAGMEQQ